MLFLKALYNINDEGGRQQPKPFSDYNPGNSHDEYMFYLPHILTGIYILFHFADHCRDGYLPGDRGVHHLHTLRHYLQFRKNKSNLLPCILILEV